MRPVYIARSVDNAPSNLTIWIMARIEGCLLALMVDIKSLDMNN